MGVEPFGEGNEEKAIYRSTKKIGEIGRKQTPYHHHHHSLDRPGKNAPSPPPRQ